MQLNHIANAAVPSSSGRTIPVIDPSDGQPFDEIQRGNAEDIDAAVRAARDCFEGVWHKVSAAERGRLLHRLSQKIAGQIDLVWEDGDWKLDPASGNDFITGARYQGQPYIEWGPKS